MDPVAKLDPMTEMALRSLHDIAVPQPVSWMPRTWGWAVLAGMILLLVVFTAIRTLHSFRRNAYRRDALQRLAVLESEMTAPSKRNPALRKLAELLKRTALAAWPRAKVAELTGVGWTRFLGRSGGAGQELARLLDDLEYHEDAALASLSEDQTRNALRAARQWIEKHHVPV